MKKYTFRTIAIMVVVLCAALQTYGQTKAVMQPDLSKLIADRKIRVVNRNISQLQEGKYTGLHLDERDNDGVAWLENISFSNGTIECDIRGKDKFQESFLGIAFNRQNDETYEAIYFRPFNFKADDPGRKSHAVQYIYHPDNGWKKLRTEFPGVYENAILPAPDPNEWFHVRIVVENPTVTVFVNDATSPSLEVKRLSKAAGGEIGFWVGYLSAGDFANLKITPADKR